MCATLTLWYLWPAVFTHTCQGLINLIYVGGLLKDNGPVNMQKKREETPTPIDCPQISFQAHSESKRESRMVITVYRRGSCPLAVRKLSWEAIIRFAEL